MARTRMDRIDSLLDPDSLISEDRRAAQHALEWDPTETVGRKITRLSYHLGAQWLGTAHDTMDGETLRTSLIDMLLHRLPNEVEEPLRWGGYHSVADRMMIPASESQTPDWAQRIITSRGYPSKRAYAIMRVGELTRDGARALGFTDETGAGHEMAVVLATGVRHVSRSMFGEKADHPGLDDRSCSWPAPGPAVFKFIHHRDGRPDFVARIDVEMLSGHHRLREVVEELTGIDISKGRPDLRLRYDITPAQMEGRARLLEDLGVALDRIAMNEDAHRLQALNMKDRRTGSIAGAFDDKIVVSRQVAALAATSPLVDLFSHVEYDEDIDRSKIGQMEQEIIIAMRHLPRTGDGLSAFRVRKLGKYRDNTMGVYSPFHNAIALDDGKATRNGYSGLSAFIHEYAHHLDHTSRPGTQLSMGAEFRPMLTAVVRDVETLDGYSRAFRDYLKTPTEAFARSFEYWCSEVKGIESSLLATHDTYRTNDRYRAMREHPDLLDRSMGSLFPDLESFDTLASEQVRRAEQGESVDYTGAVQMDIFDLLGMPDQTTGMAR